MNRRLLMIGLATALWLSAAGTPAGAADPSQREVERYQLFNAEYNSATIQRSQTTIFLEKRLFKIDAQTGETWMLIDAIRDGRDIKYWKKITEKSED